jgi:Immunity protein Imm6
MVDKKTIDLQETFKKLTLRGQAALLLSVAEMIIGELCLDNHGLSLARNAIDDCWKWIEKTSIAGDALYEYVDNEDEEKDLGARELYYQKQNNHVMVAVVIALTCIVGYIARLAYIIEGERYFPVCIEMMDREFVNYIIENACKSTMFDIIKARKVVNYLANNNLASDPEEELGSFISKDEIMLVLCG